MGSLFGAYLAEAGNDVWLLDERQDLMDAINANGLVIETAGEQRCVNIAASTNPAVIGPCDLVIIFVKSSHTQAAAQASRPLLKSSTLLLTLQNGLGNADDLEKVHQHHGILAGTTAHGSTLIAPGRIRHAGSGPTVIGPWHGCRVEDAQRMAEFLSAAGIHTRPSDNIRLVIWEKLLINIGINAITALTGIKNGQILDLDATRWLCQPLWGN
jgi:2-dehydropantoate 2-reductase